MPESYLVTGGAGLLGTHIVNLLLKRGETFVAIFDRVSGTFDDRVKVFIGDITDRASLEDAVKASGATCIIHTVAVFLQGNTRDVAFNINLGGTRSVVDVAQSQGVPKLVYTSSASVVYNGGDQANVDESWPYPDVPFDTYNETKALAEQAVLRANGQSGLSTTSLRVAGLFGPGDRLAVTKMMETMASGRTNMQLGDNTNLFDWTYIENAAHAHLLAADRLSPNHPKYHQVAGQAFFITNGEPLPYWDFPRGLWKVAGHTPTNIIAIPKFFAFIIGAISEFVGWLLGKPMLLNRFVVTIVTSTRWCNIDKARRALDYDPEIPLQEGMRRSVEWWLSTQKTS